MATYVLTDLHGQYDLWNAVKKYLKDNDTLFFLGDAIDRGDRGFEIFMELLDDPRVIYIKGNHEDMMYNAFYSSGLAASEWFKEWMKNGGQETLDNIKKLDLHYEKKMNYIDKIRTMATSLTYVNKDKTCFLLSHAGVTPNEKYFTMESLNRENYEIWNRKHIVDEWPEEYADKDIIIIHGHTPVQLMYQIDPTFPKSFDGFPVKYCDGHKINLDSACFSSNLITLYNLDTNKVEILVKGE